LRGFNHEISVIQLTVIDCQQSTFFYMSYLKPHNWF
jgi:hypothetical protein